MQIPQAHERIFRLQRTRSSSPTLWLFGGLGAFALAAVGFAVVVMTGGGMIRQQLLTTLPILVGIGAIVTSRTLARSPHKVGVGAVGVRFVAGRKVRKYLWQEIGWSTIQASGMNVRRHLLLYDTGGRPIAKLSDGIADFDEMAEMVATYIAAKGDTTAEQIQLRSAPATPADLDQALVLSLAHFVEKEGKPVPGDARMEFLVRKDGAWSMTAVEDGDSNVFHKVMHYDGQGASRLLSLGGMAAAVKTWTLEGGTLTPSTEWQQDFGGSFSRMRDAEIADLYGDGKASIAVATHDQGIVSVLRPKDGGGFEVVQLDAKPDTFVHEIEIGDVNGDGVLEVYATPSDPNKLDGSVQTGEVVRYTPSAGVDRTLVADLGDRHAKEILVADVDGDGTDELYVSVEGHTDSNKKLVDPVEVRRYEADTPADQGVVIATLQDRLSRFLTAGDVDGDGKQEIVAASFSSGVWLLRPGSDPNAAWQTELVDRDTGGFEHASILTDLDGDGKDELYVASDRHKEVRRYVWVDGKAQRETIYTRPDDRPVFTWNLMPVPVSLVPSS